ncbi:MAG: PhzF family phenazine biosynthesis protein [Actinobacteria bacterium]|nr:MAG: PhzF family phenazine biosynthesis protein [Actinomycetota bacterium]
MRTRAFRQVDVFCSSRGMGNGLAVVHDADGLGDEDMQSFAHWTNLSETTFLLSPTSPGADYRVRIFTPGGELPFAGHPTLGTCHAWLEAGGAPAQSGVVIQECGVGLVPVQRGERLAFAAPPLLRDGPVDAATLDSVLRCLALDGGDVIDAQWVDNGPGWVAVLLRDADAVLRVKPAAIEGKIGVVGLHPSGSGAAIEVRAFFEVDGVTREDPVTGSLNASVAQWLLGSGRVTAPYVATQGGALGRAGEVHVAQDADGTIWVGGAATTYITGTVDLP